MRDTTKKTGALLAVLAFAFGVQASVVIDWAASADYGNQPWHGSSGATNISLSTDTAFWSGTGVTSIYGAYNVGGPSVGALTANGSNGIQLRLMAANDDSVGDTIRNYQYTMYLFKAEDFLVSGSTTFDQTTNSSFSLTSASYADGAGYAESSFIIVDSGKYYVSSDVGLGNKAGDGTTLTWAEWADPAGDIDGVTEATELVAGLTYSSMTFTNVQAVGYYNYIARDASGTTFDFKAFEVQTIPEPATLGLFGMASLAILLIRRRLSK